MRKIWGKIRKIKKYRWYFLQAFAITGMAFAAGILAPHVQKMGNMFTSPVSWEEKCASIASYWHDSQLGIYIMLTVFIVFLFLYVFVRGHSDKYSEGMLNELKAINKKLDKITPAESKPLGKAKENKTKKRSKKGV
jgi:hypothetical protein